MIRLKVILLSILSGFAFVKNQELDDFILLAVIPMFAFLHELRPRGRRILGLVTFLLLLQYVIVLLEYGVNRAVTYVGFYLVFFLAAYLCFNRRYMVHFKVLLNVFVLLSYLALLYHITILIIGEEFLIDLGSRFASLDSRGSPNFVVINHRLDTSTDYFRSSGPFWEPGSFAVYLALLVYQGIRLQVLTFRNYLVLAITIVSTFSTTGIIMLMLISINAAMSLKIFSKTVLFSIAMLLVILTASILRGNLFYGKIQTQYETIEDDVGARNTRFAIGLYDIQDLLNNNIFFGKGPANITRFSDVDAIMTRANGLTNYLVKWGLIGLFFLLIAISKGGALWIVLILIGSISQDIFIYPLTWFLIFLNFCSE